MFKVLLVDDEPNVRQGIKMMIPWRDIDCQVIGEADDGDDGLCKIMELNPDIVIADIKMPGKSGIEMTEMAKKMGFKGKVLILSGYSDFTYAKEAIPLGVENFILKPVDEDELIDSIKSCGEKIKREQEIIYRQEKGSEYINEQIIKGLFAGNEELTANADFDYSSYTAAIISAEYGDNPSEAYAEVRRQLSLAHNTDTVTLDLSGVLGILFKGLTKIEVRSVLDKLYSEMKPNIFIAVGDTVTSLHDIEKSYTEANDIYIARFLYKHLGVVTAEMIGSSTNNEIETDYASTIYAYIEINDTAKLDRTLDGFMASLMESCISPENAKVSCITLMMDVRFRIERSASDRKPENLISDKFISELSDCDSIYEIISRMKSCLTELSNTYYGRTTKSTMERVVQYIKANYNRELKLEILAGIFGYNSAYLGKVFHQYTGENFNNYLDKIRITEAKRLLLDEEYKVYEVAEMVGYSNINYFHNKFKKYVGVSPLSYKKCKGQCDKIDPSADDTDDEE